MEDRLDISVDWCPMEDEALPARDALTLEPPFTFKETLGKKIVLIILDFLDEAPVQALAAAPAQHPEEGPLRGGVEDVQGVGEINVILRLHGVDLDCGPHLVRGHFELLEDVHLIFRLEKPRGRCPAFEWCVCSAIAKKAE